MEKSTYFIKTNKKMKYLKFLTAALLALSMVGCSGAVDNEDEVTPDGEGGTFQIVADKLTLEADGKDMVTFSVVDELGNDILSDKSYTVSIKNETTGKRLGLGRTFTSITNGNYVFTAKVTKKSYTTDTENSVTIKVQNRGQYEKYKQRVMIYKCTGTWCGYCPAMTAALHSVSEEYQQHMAVMALHNADNFAIQINGMDLVQYIGSARGYGQMSLPSNIYDSRELSGERSTIGIQEYILKYLSEYPATCGVKIASTKREGEKITVDCALKTTKAGKYDLGCALLCDNLYYSGGTATDNIYSDVVLSTTANYTGTLSQDYWMMQPDVEQSKTFTIEGVSEQYRLEDLKVVVFAITELEDGSSIIDNCQICHVGEQVDYILNE